jgi:GT2 family glycosyltransferase
MIYTNIPYTPNEYGTNLGYAYNKFMELLPNDDDWACFLDHDAMFTTSNWYHQLETIIKNNPDVGAFGARTNRVANTFQLVGNINLMSNDIEYHRNVGKYIQSKYYDDLLCLEKNSTEQFGYSGVFILISKKTWKEIGGFKTKGFTEVDNDLRKRLHENKIKFCILNGVYVYHWYRFDNKYRHSRKLLDRLQRMFKTNKDLTFDDIFLFDK